MFFKNAFTFIIFQKFNPVEITFSNSSKKWAEHMIAYSERHDEVLLAQLYFELANHALVMAKAE